MPNYSNECSDKIEEVTVKSELFLWFLKKECKNHNLMAINRVDVVIPV
jgi:hypothetical protein